MEIEVKHSRVLVNRGHWDNVHVINEFYVDGEKIEWDGSSEGLMYLLEQDGDIVNLIEETINEN